MEVSAKEAIELAREWGSPAPLAPLMLTYEMCETDENIKRNIEATLAMDYRPFNTLLSPPHERVVSVVGFGPSIKETWTMLQGDIWACNGAHDWLIERGVIPKYAMYYDASPVIEKFIGKPHKDVTYLVASRCHQNVFDALEGYNVYVWHSAGDPCMDDILCAARRAEPMLGGGSAAATTAMVVATTMDTGKSGCSGPTVRMSVSSRTPRQASWMKCRWKSG